MMLEARSVSLAHGRREVVSDVSFSLRPGELVALVGANGSGKSTLLRGLARIQRPTRGQVLLAGMDLRRMHDREVAKVLAVLPQSPQAPNDLLVEELVSRGRFPHQSLFGGVSAQDRAAIAAAMEAAGVSDLAHRRLGSLSGGERQRSWIALALAQEPKFLLLDEPTTSLDMRHQVEIMAMLQRLNSEAGITVLVALHDLAIAARFADRVLALREGRVEFDGPALAVLTPSALERVFGLPMLVVPHPETGAPIALPAHPARSHSR